MQGYNNARMRKLKVVYSIGSSFISPPLRGEDEGGGEGSMGRR